MNCSLLFSLTFSIPVPGGSVSKPLFETAAWPFKSGVSSTSAFPLSITIQAAVRMRNSPKFFSSITTLPFWTDFLLKGFLRTYANIKADLTTNRLISSSFVEPRTTHSLSGTLWEDNISWAMEKSYSASFPHHHMMLCLFPIPSRRNLITHFPNSRCQLNYNK